MKMPRYWHAKGEDKEGGKWEGCLMVEHDPDAFMKSGFFEWSRKQGGGRLTP